MTKLFFKENMEPDWDKMLDYIKETYAEPYAEIAFICKVVTARALDRLSRKE